MRNRIHYVVAGLNAFAAFFAIISAIRWHQSATFEASAEQGEWVGPEIMAQGTKGKKMPVVATLKGQARISKSAAWMAALAAGFQAMALLVQAFAT